MAQIVISACKTGSAKKVTAVLPIFPYSRQPDLPYNKVGAPLSKPAVKINKDYTFESVPATPGPGVPQSKSFGAGIDITKMLGRAADTSGHASPITTDDPSSTLGRAGLNTASGRAEVGSIPFQVGARTLTIEPTLGSIANQHIPGEEWIQAMGCAGRYSDRRPDNLCGCRSVSTAGYELQQFQPPRGSRQRQ